MAFSESQLLYNHEIKKTLGNKFKSKTIPTMIYGIIFSDDIGRTILINEYVPNALKHLMNKDEDGNFDLELIPMFLNALRKFGEEINIHGHRKFEIFGDNMSLRSITIGLITMTVISSANLFIKQNGVRIERFFNKFLSDNQKNLEDFLRTGLVYEIKDYQKNIHQFIKNFNGEMQKDHGIQ